MTPHSLKLCVLQYSPLYCSTLKLFLGMTLVLFERCLADILTGQQPFLAFSPRPTHGLSTEHRKVLGRISHQCLSYLKQIPSPARPYTRTSLRLISHIRGHVDRVHPGSKDSHHSGRTYMKNR